MKNKMQKFDVLVLSFLLFSILYSCASKPDFTEAPQIEFVSFSKSQLFQSSTSQDTLFLTIKFTDGDGDIGNSSNMSRNIFIVDKRTDSIYTDFKIPTIPQEGVNNGIQGTIRMMMFSTCCVFPDNIPPCESPIEYPEQDLNLDIYIVDDAGNQSNVISPPALRLICSG